VAAAVAEAQTLMPTVQLEKQTPVRKMEAQLVRKVKTGAAMALVVEAVAVALLEELVELLQPMAGTQVVRVVSLDET
jgi:hypothetical protein